MSSLSALILAHISCISGRVSSPGWKTWHMGEYLRPTCTWIIDTSSSTTVMTHRPPITCRRRHQQWLYNSCKGQVWLRIGQSESGEAAEPGVCWADSPQDPLGMERSTRQRCWLDNQFLKSSYSHRSPPCVLMSEAWVLRNQSNQVLFWLALWRPEFRGGARSDQGWHHRSVSSSSRIWDGALSRGWTKQFHRDNQSGN